MEESDPFCFLLASVPISSRRFFQIYFTFSTLYGSGSADTAELEFCLMVSRELIIGTVAIV